MSSGRNVPPSPASSRGAGGTGEEETEDPVCAATASLFCMHDVRHKACKNEKTSLQPLFYTAAGFADTSQHTQLQMFVIKNLDTGLEMRIDDFDRLAHIATDPDPANQVRLAAHMQHTQLQVRVQGVPTQPTSRLVLRCHGCVPAGNTTRLQKGWAHEGHQGLQTLVRRHPTHPTYIQAAVHCNTLCWSPVVERDVAYMHTMAPLAA